MPSALRKGLLYGTGALFLVVLVLFIYKAPLIFGAKPQPPAKVIINHQQMLDHVKDLGAQAAREFADAKRIKDDQERNKAIRGALETLTKAEELLGELRDKPEYQGEEFDSVFDDLQIRFTMERREYRNAITIN